MRRALVAGAILATNFRLRRAQLLEEFQRFVRGVAGTTALALSGEEISTIHTQADTSTPAFEKSREMLERSRADVDRRGHRSANA